MSSKFIVAGNLKMHMNPKEAEDYFSRFLKEEKDSGVEVLFFPPSIDLTVAQSQLAGSSVGWGPQHIHFEEKGAFTGEISASMVSSMGATHVLVGHSERRTLFGETDESCSKKVHGAQSQELTPILCIGETLQERQSNKTKDVLKQQLKEGLKSCSRDKGLIIAYEPVWAIGTGEVASVEQVREAHEFIRLQLVDILGDNGKNVSILYGGSVKAGNAGELSQMEQVGGFLVGSASLKVESFCDIIKASHQ